MSDTPRVKVRYTTRDTTWTMPSGNDPRVDDFFHGEPWDELHIVHKESKQLLARYTRSEVISMYARQRESKRTVTGHIVKAFAIKPILVSIDE